MKTKYFLFECNMHVIRNPKTVHNFPIIISLLSFIEFESPQRCTMYKKKLVLPVTMIDWWWLYQIQRIHVVNVAPRNIIAFIFEFIAFSHFITWTDDRHAAEMRDLKGRKGFKYICMKKTLESALNEIYWNWKDPLQFCHMTLLGWIVNFIIRLKGCED